ncbi:hypothetical protein SKAU_G00387300 [Synaphobranchus kaupii]|uniref:Reverse transcriptase domain-containing protein n=1 Tax=Synaphobranchus kaupii TaxID=118154 RepID=A0A9Q1EAR3_SYNKA|nr:hypothetical protein SKAU_G00387300 [Synaphobranchus kaupii]
MQHMVQMVDGEEVRDEEEGVQLVDQLWREVEQGKQEELGGIIKREEVREALSSLKNGKAPRRDGIPKEVYSTFWDIMSDDLVELFNEIGRRGEMPLSMREGIIHLLHKKGDRRDLGNWRPVTLLGADYKVLGRVLANKAKAVLGEVLSPDQTCRVPKLLRRDVMFQGLHAPGGEGERVKVLQYAGDTTVLVSSDRDVRRVMELVGKYCGTGGTN